MLVSKHLLLLLPLLLLCVRANGQTDRTSTRTLSVTGRVIDAGTRGPIAGAVVRLIDTRYGAVTDVEGRFRIYDVPAGAYRASITSIGYESVIKTDIVVSNARPVDLEVELLEQAVSSDGVVVRPDYFERNIERARARTLDNEEIRRLPGGFEDVVRAISTLPGVAQVSNGRNDLLVRGGAPSENLYLVDGIEVPNINHFGTQGAGGGPLSFINLDFVRDLSFSTGGFDARYGDRISSVMDIRLRSGREDRIGGKGTISATQFGLNLEGPISSHGSAILSARRSYLDLIFRAAGFSFVPEYWDFFAKVDYDLGESDKLSALAIGAIDRVRQFDRDEDDRFNNSRILDNSQNQLVSGVTWKHLMSNSYLNVTLGRTIIDYRFRQTDTLARPIFTNTSTEDETNLRVDLGIQFGDETRLAIGGTAKRIAADAVVALDQGTRRIDLASEEIFTKGAIYAQLFRPIIGGLELTVGGRLDYFSGIEQTLAPSFRTTLSYPIDDRSRLSLSAGRYFQAPSYIWLIANDQNRNLKSIRADVGVLGVDRIFGEATRVSLEGYYKRYDDYPASIGRQYLVLANTGAGFGGAEDGFASFGLEPLASLGQGRSYGVELLVQKKLSEIPCYGLLGLSYNRSWFTAADGIERPGDFDQRIVGSIAGGYRLNDEWEIGIKFRFATGRPYTPVDSTGDPSFGYRVTSLYNTARLDPTHALDLRIDRRWSFESWSLITYVDIQNVYNRKNATPPVWNARLGRGEISGGQIGILPSIGVSAEW